MRRIPLVFGAAALVMLTSVLPSAATFPGANGRIAFGDFAGRQIFSIQPDGRGRMRLTHTARRVNSQPAWSADGSQIVYVRQTANRWLQLAMCTSPSMSAACSVDSARSTFSKVST